MVVVEVWKVWMVAENDLDGLEWWLMFEIVVEGLDGGG